MFWKKSSDGQDEPELHSTQPQLVAETDLETRNYGSDSTLPGQRPYIDPALERRVVRKLDMHLMPLIMALCKWISLPPGYRIRPDMLQICSHTWIVQISGKYEPLHESLDTS